MGAELDQIRLAALHQAAHDLKGQEWASTVVERAKVYLAFLRGDDEKSKATSEQRYDMANDKLIDL